MLRKLMNKIYGNHKGITGLETAIILIAFVVVAAVFAYTVLSAVCSPPSNPMMRSIRPGINPEHPGAQGRHYRQGAYFRR